VWLVYLLLVVSALLVVFCLRQLTWNVLHRKELLPEEQRLWVIYVFLLTVGLFGLVATVSSVIYEQPYWIVDKLQSVVANLK